VHLTADVAEGVRERHSHWMDITDLADGSITARFDVAELDWATGWVLSFGAAARVLEPDELIARVQAAAHGALKRYDRSQSQLSQNSAPLPRLPDDLVARQGFYRE